MHGETVKFLTLLRCYAA